MSVPQVQDNRKEIKHVVVLMLENRSFDHMLGYMKQVNPNINGVDEHTSCPVDPTDPSKGVVHASPTATPVSVDPIHSLEGTTLQLYGTDIASGPAKNNGFVASYAQPDPKAPEDIMKCQSVENVSALSTLASEFALFDHYYSGIPGPTQPNRLMFMCSTSEGSIDNDPARLVMGYNQKSVFDSLTENGNEINCYWSDFPIVAILRRMRAPKYWGHLRYIDQFYNDCANGTLGALSWVEPRWFDFMSEGASDQHPPHNVILGEEIVAKVYEAVRASPCWENTMLIVTYDEHGGFYDHVPPPINVPPPDDYRPPKGKTPFEFDRLGVRVPMIVASPWINKGTVVHEAPVAAYCHSSFSATLKDLFGLPSFLTKRDAWACSYSDVVNGRTTPRTDCPMTLPVAPRAPMLAAPSRMPITELQREIISIARGIMPDRNLGLYLENEHEGSIFVQTQMTSWLHMQTELQRQAEESPDSVIVHQNPSAYDAMLYRWARYRYPRSMGPYILMVVIWFLIFYYFL